MSEKDRLWHRGKHPGCRCGRASTGLELAFVFASAPDRYAVGVPLNTDPPHDEKCGKLALAAVAFVVAAGCVAFADDFPVTITGGHDIGRDDLGRPSTLIAAGLGVKTEVFPAVTAHRPPWCH